MSLPAPPAVSPNGTVVEYPIVRVNDQIIDNSDYLRSEHQLEQEAQQSNASPADLAERKKDLLRDMIDQQLLLSRGKELDINADAEVIRRLDDIRKQNHLDSMEALEKAVRDSGISFEDFKSNIKNQIITQEVVRDEVGRNLRLTAKDEQAYYEKHKQEFAQPEQVRLSEILIPTPDDATDAQIAQAQAKANDVAAKIKAGDSFDALAKQYSGGPNADSGGDLGEFKSGQLAKVLEDETFPLKVGQSTAPIRTRQGFVILKVTEHTPAGIPPLSAVDEQVQQAMYQEAIQPALRTYLSKLREEAYIDIAPGFVDTGASPKQTKIVYSGATPPPSKKKKAAKGRLDQTHSNATTAASTTPSSAAGGATAASAAAGSSAQPPANRTAGRVPENTLVASTKATNSRKRKKIKREKIRFGQAPRNPLPPSPDETIAAGSDQGPGSAATLPTAGQAIAPLDQGSNVATSLDPLAPVAAPPKKTRYSDRAATEKQEKAAAKIAKAKQKIAATPPPMTAEEKQTVQVQDAALGLNGDTATKKKHKRKKGEAKQRIQTAPPAPPAPKPDATPIPPKTVRDNGEPTVNPAPAQNLPPVAPPTSSTPSDSQNPAPAQNSTPATTPATPQQ